MLNNAADIDIIAYQLVDQLDFRPILQSINTFDQSEKISGIPFGANLGEVDISQIDVTDHFGNVVSMFIPGKEVEVGFGVEKFKQIITIASNFLEKADYAQYADNAFVEKEIFNWIINTYKTQRATSDLIPFLEKRIDEETRDYTFYFKIFSLGIQSEFNVGKVNFFAFTPEYLSSQFDKLSTPYKSWNDFQLSFEYFVNSIVASTTIKSVKTKAETMAKSEVALSINALKCFLSPESLAPHIQIFDVDFKASDITSSRFIITNNMDERMKITLQKINGTVPVILDHSLMERLRSKGLTEMSDFLSNAKNLEFHLLLMQAIEQFGTLISTRNFHERIVLLISFFELFLNSETSSRSKAQTYLKNNILPAMLRKSDVETFKQKIIKIYTIRDKYLHNRVLMPIDHQELFQVQSFAFEFLNKLIKLRNMISTKEQFYDHFNIPY